MQHKLSSVLVLFLLLSACAEFKNPGKRELLSQAVPAADIVVDQADAMPIDKRGGEFTLYGSTGAISLSDFKGKVVAIYFGYTSCPDVCPTSLAMLSSALKQLGAEELHAFQGVFISVDPGRDSPEKLAEYAHHFHPSIMGVSAAPADLDPVVAQYGAYYEKTNYSNSALLYGIAHTSEIYIVGRDGKLHTILEHATLPDKILESIRAAMAAKP